MELPAQPVTVGRVYSGTLSHEIPVGVRAWVGEYTHPTITSNNARHDMSSNSKAPLIIPILIIGVGVGWLLTAQGVGQGINWVWTIGLGLIGIVVFVVSQGFDKVSIVLGPFFLLASLLSVLRQTGRLGVETELPLLVISIGILLLIAQLPGIPKPGWYVELPPSAEGRGTGKK